MSVEKMEKDVEAKRRKLNVANVDEKSQKYLKQLKGWNLPSTLSLSHSRSAGGGGSPPQSAPGNPRGVVDPC